MSNIGKTEAVYEAIKDVPIGLLFTKNELDIIRNMLEDGFIHNLNNEDNYYNGKGFAHNNSNDINNLISRLFNLAETYYTPYAIESLTQTKKIRV